MQAPVRLVGVDVARGVAVLGMFFAHVADDGTTDALADGRSSVLFATLAGVSLGLLTGGPRPVRERRAARVSVGLRGLVLIALGLLLWTLGTPIAVILDSYGVLFLVLLPVLFAPPPVLAGVAIAAALAGPPIVRAVGEDLATPFSPARLTGLPGEWFVTGYYPGVVWAAYVCAGLLVARLDLAARRIDLALVVGGGGASVLGYGGAAALGLDASAHANTTAEVLGSGGLALALIGALQLLCGPTPAGAVARRLLAPLAAVGSMPLTVYVGQLVVVALFLLTPAAGDPPWIASWPLLVGLVVGALLFATVWRRFVGRGPMEALMAALTRVPPRERVDALR